MATTRASWQLPRGAGHLVLTLALRSKCPECEHEQTNKAIAPARVNDREFGLNVRCMLCHNAYNIRLSRHEMEVAEEAIEDFEASERSVGRGRLP